MNVQNCGRTKAHEPHDYMTCCNGEAAQQAQPDTRCDGCKDGSGCTRPDGFGYTCGPQQAQPEPAVYDYCEDCGRPWKRNHACCS